MTDLLVDVRLLPHATGMALPTYRSAQAAGMDLHAALAEGESLRLEPGDYAAVPTGVTMALPPGYEGQVRARSGLALEYGIGVLNAPGTVDADYRGEVKVILVNRGRRVFRVDRDMRIAQMVIAPVARIAWRSVSALPPSARGDKGFGSTGTGGRDADG